MSHPLKVDDGSLELSMQFSGETPESTDAKFKAVLLALQDCRQATNVKEFSVVEVGLGLSDWSVEHEDGRRILGQVDDRVDPNNPTITFATDGDGWLVRELVSLANLRNTLIVAHFGLGAVSITVEWYPE